MNGAKAYRIYEDSNLTMTAFADLLGIARTTVWSWKDRPKSRVLEAHSRFIRILPQVLEDPVLAGNGLKVLIRDRGPLFAYHMVLTRAAEGGLL